MGKERERPLAIFMYKGSFSLNYLQWRSISGALVFVCRHRRRDEKRASERREQEQRHKPTLFCLCFSIFLSLYLSFPAYPYLAHLILQSALSVSVHRAVIGTQGEIKADATADAVYTDASRTSCLTPSSSLLSVSYQPTDRCDARIVTFSTMWCGVTIVLYVVKVAETQNF